jgi:hypothetical protein
LNNLYDILFLLAVSQDVTQQDSGFDTGYLTRQDSGFDTGHLTWQDSGFDTGCGGALTDDVKQLRDEIYQLQKQVI